MTVTLELPPEKEAMLKAQAQACGVSAERLLLELSLAPREKILHHAVRFVRFPGAGEGVDSGADRLAEMQLLPPPDQGLLQTNRARPCL